MGGVLHIMAYTPPEKGTFFRLQIYARVGILIVEVYERVGKSLIWVCGKGPKGRTDEFYGFIESGKRSVFVTDPFLFKRQCIYSS